MKKLLKLFCYQKENHKKLLECSEVTIQAPPDVLREIATFLIDSANKMENLDGDAHFHLQDQWQGWCDEFPDLIAAMPDKEISK